MPKKIPERRNSVNTGHTERYHDLLNSLGEELFQQTIEILETLRNLLPPPKASGQIHVLDIARIQNEFIERWSSIKKLQESPAIQADVRKIILLLKEPIIKINNLTQKSARLPNESKDKLSREELQFLFDQLSLLEEIVELFRFAIPDEEDPSVPVKPHFLQRIDFLPEYTGQAAQSDTDLINEAVELWDKPLDLAAFMHSLLTTEVAYMFLGLLNDAGITFPPGFNINVFLTSVSVHDLGKDNVLHQVSSARVYNKGEARLIQENGQLNIGLLELEALDNMLEEILELQDEIDQLNAIIATASATKIPSVKLLMTVRNLETNRDQLLHQVILRSNKILLAAHLEDEAGVLEVKETIARLKDKYEAAREWLRIQNHPLTGFTRMWLIANLLTGGNLNPNILAHLQVVLTHHQEYPEIDVVNLYQKYFAIEAELQEEWTELAEFCTLLTTLCDVFESVCCTSNLRPYNSDGLETIWDVEKLATKLDLWVKIINEKEFITYQSVVKLFITEVESLSSYLATFPGIADEKSERIFYAQLGGYKMFKIVARHAFLHDLVARDIFGMDHESVKAQLKMPINLREKFHPAMRILIEQRVRWKFATEAD